MRSSFDIVGTVAIDLHGNLESVRKRIQGAAAAAGRNPDEIKLVAVSKTYPAAVLREAIAAGVYVFGENKVQEAEGKIVEIGRYAAEWHLVGHLQSNKARRAVQLFDTIHSVDSIELATRLERICVEENRPELSVLVQVDLAAEESKGGIEEHQLQPLVDYLKICRRLRFAGFMVLPPYFDNPEDARPYFRKLRGIRDRIAAQHAFGDRTGELSMGMSHDFEVAIEEGATIVRVGTAIFGERE